MCNRKFSRTYRVERHYFLVRWVGGEGALDERVGRGVHGEVGADAVPDDPHLRRPYLVNQEGLDAILPVGLDKIGKIRQVNCLNFAPSKTALDTFISCWKYPEHATKPFRGEQLCIELVYQVAVVFIYFSHLPLVVPLVVPCVWPDHVPVEVWQDDGVGGVGGQPVHQLHRPPLNPAVDVVAPEDDLEKGKDMFVWYRFDFLFIFIFLKNSNLKN